MPDPQPSEGVEMLGHACHDECDDPCPWVEGVEMREGEGFLTQVMTLVAEEDLDLEHLWPRVDDGNIRLLINCNDFFYWGTADAEELTATDLPLLQQCVDDLKAAEEFSEDYCWLLFCARKREMRPQHPFFRTYSPKERAYVGDQLSAPVRALFDACGPDGSDKVSRG